MTVAATNHPQAISLGDITLISGDAVKALAETHPDCTFIIGAGPPCQDVSLLNAARRGATGDRSNLREEYKRFFYDLQQAAPGRVFGIMECTNMTTADR
eukprot:3750363-Heterocapsa_arctica.AAC.1